ncbi:MAG TPA: hypothetical protein VFE78_18610, partial [Gemmataceae bacterium]|nr:hypothetical protein [Gemmataceae bacterium]
MKDVALTPLTPPAQAAAPAPASTTAVADPAPARRLQDAAVVRTVVFALTAAIVIVGLRQHVPGGITAVNVVAFALTLVWALAGLLGLRPRDREVDGLDLSYVLAAGDALLAAAALTAGRMAQS